MMTRSKVRQRILRLDLLIRSTLQPEQRIARVLQLREEASRLERLAASLQDELIRDMSNLDVNRRSLLVNKITLKLMQCGCVYSAAYNVALRRVRWLDSDKGE
jgi:hypothetical protein